ncbi:unnamed protein product [Danaus chrysippus]|uniref:(African queen) hypothetical protein n=1 Tax=Danaus chrysippus TaxID=151541 RepID=A0A8J2W865_9NEOP|nr:unnamed protein product [Danaus chrysippus]
MWSRIYLIVACVVHVWSELRVDPLVQTKSGLIRGLKADDGNYSMFLGVPYARINETDPFGPAASDLIFDGIFEANNDSAICPQVDDNTKQAKGTLDCLRMNIFEKFFDKAILQSGSNLKPGGLMEVDITPALKVAGKLGLETQDVTKAMNFIKQIDPHTIVKTAIDLGIKLRGCVERDINGVEPIITEHFLNIDMPKLKNTPILAGFNTREGLGMNKNKEDVHYMEPYYFEDNLKLAFHEDEEFDEMCDIVRNFYIGDEDLNEDVRNNIIDFEGDYYYGYPVQESLKIYVERGALRVYQYLFSYDGDRNLIKKTNNITNYGASHADELSYLFDHTLIKEKPSDDDQLIIDRMTKLWTNFAKYGDPTPEVTELLPIKWTPISADKYIYLDIDKEFAIKSRPFKQRLTFWELFYKANMKKIRGYKAK